MTFGERLKDLIEAFGLTQKEFAQIMNLSHGAITRYINGSREPDIDMLKKIGSYFNVSIDYLLDCELDSIDTRILTSDELLLLSYYRTMDRSDKDMVLDVCKSCVKRKKSLNAKSS